METEQIEAGEEAADDAAKGVGGIQTGHLAGGPATRAEGPGGNRQGAPHRQRGNEEEEADGEPLDRPGKGPGGGDCAGEQQPAEGREGLEGRAGPERIGRRRDQPRHQDRPRPEAGHEGGEDDGERPRRPPDLEDEELKPDDLVDERRGAAGDEQRQEKRSRFHQAACIPSP